MRRMLRMSLRTALLLLTALCVLLGLKAKQVRDQQQAVEAILAAGGRIHYDDELDPETMRRIEPRGLRSWLAKRIGPHYVCRVRLVTLYPSADFPADEQVKMLAGLPYLQNLAIWPGSRGKVLVDENSLGGLSDTGLQFVAAHLPRLRHLSVTASTVTTEGLECLAGSDELESLQVSSYQDRLLVDITAFQARHPRVNAE